MLPLSCKSVSTQKCAFLYKKHILYKKNIVACF